MARKTMCRMNIPDLIQSAEFAALRAVATRLGNDPLQIQGPGGNVSIKANGKMLVKASGTWLADAERDEIFAPVDAHAMKHALLDGNAAVDKPAEFLLSGTLRPSIETSFHAALDAPVVLHTHCVATLARSTAPIATAELDALKLVFVPYQKPGGILAKSILEVWHPGAKGAVLGNHGLITTGETVAEAEALIHQVARYFDQGAVPIADPAPGFADMLSRSGWSPLGAGATTALAFNSKALAKAAGSALFPDQVIFLGPSPLISDLPFDVSDKLPAHLVLVPGQGAGVSSCATPAVVAVAEMMGEVVFRLPDSPTRLGVEETNALLDWDAEKYRQALERVRAGRSFGDG